MKIKYLIYSVILIPLLAWADMIEWQDDDQVQFITFECDPALYDSVKVWNKIAEVDPYTFIGAAIVDTVWTFRFGYVRADRDGQNRQIGGYYHGEYWYYNEYFLLDGSGSVIDPDVNHMVVDYTIGCGSMLHVD